MTDDRSLERAARSWLEVGPTAAPDAAVEAALARIQTTPQERDLHLPWRTTRLNQLVRASIGIAAVVVVLVGAALLINRPGPGPATSPSPVTASPSPTASASSSPIPPSASPGSSAGASGSPFPLTFVSKRMGYSVGYPDRWSVHPATADWTDPGPISWGGGSNDDLHGSDARLSVASQPLKPGVSPASRLQALIAASPVCTAAFPAPATIKVGDQTGTVAVNGCVNLGVGGMIPGGRAYVVLLVTGGRAYDFILDGNVDAAYLQAIMATVKLDPASAVDPSPTP
jgi:hypothetical protein